MKIRQTVSAIYDDMDYWTGTDNEQLAILRDIVHKQNNSRVVCQVDSKMLIGDIEDNNLAILPSILLALH